MENKDKKPINSIIEKNTNNINKKTEWENSFNEEYSVSSINNGINPIINILIDSVDNFTFGEILEEEKINDKTNMTIPPDNYLSINNKKELIKENDIITKIEDIICFKNNISKKQENKNHNKFICGIFTKEDFDIKMSFKHHTNLNDSYEKKFINPLEKENNNDKEYNTIKNNNQQFNDFINLKDKDKKENNIPNKIGNSNDIYNDNNLDKEVKFNNCNEYNYDAISQNHSQKIDFNNLKNDSKSNYDLLNEENMKTKIEEVFYQDNNNITSNNNIKDDIKEKSINLSLYLNNIENEEKKIVVFNKIMDIDVKEKLLELSEKFERSENNIKVIKNTNEKLMEIIKNFKISEKNKNLNSEENIVNNSSKKSAFKKRFYCPSSNNLNKKIDKDTEYKKDKNTKKEKHKNNHKKSKSFSKLKVFVDINNLGKNNKEYINYKKIKKYSLSKVNSYSEIYNKEKNHKKNIKNKLYKKEKIIKSDRSNFIRRTIFLTGNINYSNKKNNNINKNNYIHYPGKIDLDNHEMINGNYLYYHSFPSSRKNSNNSEILISNGIGNIYQREIMKLPPDQQPLFYESSCKFSKSNYLKDNNNINNDCNDTFSFIEQKQIFDEKYNYNYIYNNKKNNITDFNHILSESNKNGINYLNIYGKGNKNNIIIQRENKSNIKIHKNKLLDFKDFQVIFEEKEDNLDKAISKINNNNIINQAYTVNNSYRNKYLEKNLINKKYNLNNKNLISSLKNKISNCKKNHNNFIRENGKIIKKENIIKENGNPKGTNCINKYSDYINKKYKNLFGNQNKDKANICKRKDSGKILNINYKNFNKNSLNENKFMIPFYLININDLYLNILNSSNKKKK